MGRKRATATHLDHRTGLQTNLVGDGELCLGTWQRILFIELDRSRPRRWLCKVVGS